MVSSSRWWKKKERRYLPLLILICLIIQNFIQFNPTNYYIHQSLLLYFDYNGITTTTTMKNTTLNTTTTTTTTTNVLTFNINNITTTTTPTTVSNDDGDEEVDDDENVYRNNSTTTNIATTTTTNDTNAATTTTTITTTTTTPILNISTYDDLLEVLDFDRPHYCGYYKCYYSTTTNTHSNIGLILSQEDWITQQQFNDDTKLAVVNQQNSLPSSIKTNNLNHNIQSYYDVLYQSYVFSTQVTKEFPGIKSLLAGPPIQLKDKPTIQQLHALNHFTTTETTNVQKGDFNKRRLYTNNASQLSIQEVYEIRKIERIQIKLNGQRTIRDFLNKHIIPNFMLIYPLTEISIHIQQFINTFTVDVQEVKLMLRKYPMMGEDFQLFIHMTGHIYQTDWDRIYFIYKWCSISYDPNLKTNNHTKMIQYVIPYLDELINICYGDSMNTTIKQ